MNIPRFLLITVLLFCTGCDRIYGLLHKPGGEEHRILGEVVFNEYNPKVEELQKALSFLGYSIGTCGKSGQGVPVSDAQPTLAIRELIVGGIEVMDVPNGKEINCLNAAEDKRLAWKW